MTTIYVSSLLFDKNILSSYADATPYTGGIQRLVDPSGVHI